MSRFRIRLVTSLVVTFTILLLLTIWWMGPTPPNHIVLATGQAGGSYDLLGEKIQALLGKKGVSVTLKSSKGSLDNYRKLLAGEVDIALVQAGTYALVEKEDEQERLRGLAAVQLEPLWVFYRGKETRSILPDLCKPARPSSGKTKKLRASIGEKQSGTAALAMTILSANGIQKSDHHIKHYSLSKTNEEMLSGNLDVSFFVQSENNPTIQSLMRQPFEESEIAKQIHLFNFSRHLAYTQRYPYLTTVTIGAGALDLQKDIPSEDVKMLATSTLLVCRKELHPNVIEQILLSLDRLQSQQEIISTKRKFPTTEGMDLPAHTAAVAHERYGSSYLTRVLPYWGIWVWFKVQLVIIPLLLVWLPFFRVLPFMFRLRINWLLRKHYVALRIIEDKINSAEAVDEIESAISELDRLRDEMEAVSRKVPSHLQINVYQWRLHVGHVRNEALQRLRDAKRNNST